MHPLYAGLQQHRLRAVHARRSRVARAAGGGRRRPAKNAESISSERQGGADRRRAAPRACRAARTRDSRCGSRDCPARARARSPGLIERSLRAAGARVEVLDGDIVRTHLSKGSASARRIATPTSGASALSPNCSPATAAIAIVAAISPYRAVRDEVRSRIPNFVEVYVECPIEVLAERDVKGLYKRALAGEIACFHRGFRSVRAAPGAGRRSQFVTRDPASKAPPKSGLHWSIKVWWISRSGWQPIDRSTYSHRRIRWDVHAV